MFGKLNSGLRKLFILMGAVFALFKLLEKIEFERAPEEESVLAHEFDDIW